MNIHRLAIQPSDRLSAQLARYLVVGLVAFCVDFALLVLLAEWFQMDYLVAAAFGFLAGLVTNYWLSVAWVFQHRNIANRQAEFSIFATIGVAAPANARAGIRPGSLAGDRADARGSGRRHRLPPMAGPL